jgi:hypothetical protein
MLTDRNAIITVRQTGDAPWRLAVECQRQWLGKPVREISFYCGTYGSGGPGFLGFHVPKGWLILRLWSAADWLTVGGVPLGSHAGKYQGIVPDGLLGTDVRLHMAKFFALPAPITKFEFAGKSGHLVLGRHQIDFAKDPSKRPLWGGNDKPRVLADNEDIQDAWIFSGVPWVEI